MKASIICPIVLLALFLQGCASPKYRMVKEKKRSEPVAYNAVFVDESLKSSLNHVIYQGSPGSWKRKAWWDEYVLEIENTSGGQIIVESISIHAAGHDERAYDGDNPWKLARMSKSTARKYKEAGYNFVVVSGPQIATAAYVSTLTSSLAMVEAIVVSGTATAGYWGVVGSKNIVNGRKIKKEYNNRRINFPLALQPGAKHEGSAFFTTVPSPKLLKVVYHLSGDEGNQRELIINTPFLYGLHMGDSNNEGGVEIAEASLDAAKE